MPEGNKSRVLGYGVESNRPTTNFPGISVDTNRFDCVVEKSGLGVEPRRESPETKTGFHFVCSKSGARCDEFMAGV